MDDLDPIEDKTITVTLEWYELFQAISVGGRRRVESMRRGGQAAHGYIDDNGWTKDIEAAGAELAFSKATNQYYSGSVNTFKAADVGDRWQVRWTPNTDGRLIVRPSADDSDRYVLVTGKAPVYSVIGWITAKAAKRVSWWSAPNNRPGAYFVPQSALHSCQELLDTADDASLCPLA
ncbi:MAG: hypothetical protein JWL77_1420 [Chthonomonadaceae bacterium]|nr:hypothetical protein [Chthonomonadaceae bacterium]